MGLYLSVKEQKSFRLMTTTLLLSILFLEKHFLFIAYTVEQRNSLRK